MGFRQSTPTRTPCEILREINDLCQSDSALDKLIRKKLSEVMKGAKLMSYEIEKYDNKWNLLTWKSPNINDKADWERRLKDNYKVK